MKEQFDAIFNKLILTLLILITVGVPVYLGMAIGYTTGHRFLSQIQRQPLIPYSRYMLAATNPNGIVKGYLGIHKMAVAYKRYPQYKKYYFNIEFDAKFYGPLIGGFVLALFTLFMMRAPLMDFRPVRQMVRRIRNSPRQTACKKRVIARTNRGKKLPDYRRLPACAAIRANRLR
jgi:hypothetical protein